VGRYITWVYKTFEGCVDASPVVNDLGLYACSDRGQWHHRDIVSPNMRDVNCESDRDHISPSVLAAKIDSAIILDPLSTLRAFPLRSLYRPVVHLPLIAMGLWERS
jgi:hypothetical protein